jgi:hypothetical protein
LALKPIYKPTFAFFLTLAAAFTGLAVPGLGTTVSLPAAMISTSLDQCESQICGNPPFVNSYNGLLSGYSTQTVGEGGNVTASGFPSPTTTSQVPLGGANAIINSEVTYYIDVVPVGGGSSVTNVLLQVNGTGSSSATTVSNNGLANDGNLFLQLDLLGAGGGAVFNDISSVIYSANSTVAPPPCGIVNNSTFVGAGFVSTPGVGGATIGCGSSTMFGGINETGSYTISTNSLYEVAMIANVNVGTSNDGLAHGTGSVQAFATIDPIFTAPSGYMIVMSAGAGNGLPGAAPEPGTWVMLVAGIGGLGAIKRRAVNRASRACAPTR